MSTLPTEASAAIGVIGGADGPTAVFVAGEEANLSIESIKELMDAFDPASLLPELGSIFEIVTAVCQVAVMIAPILLLAMGLAFLFLSPKEANYYFGYRCYFGMGSVEAWQFTQRFAGIALGALGLILSGIMLFISSGFAGMDAMDMVWKAFWCLVWQGVLAFLVNAVIWIVTAIRYDGKGCLRAARRR